MTFLAIDTSGDYGVVALAQNDGMVKAVSVFESRRMLSRRLLGIVDVLLRENGLSLRELTGLAVGIGPGSFTGLRVGLTTMKTLARVTGLPLVGVGTLDAYAYGAAASVIVVATPSRRGEVYAAIYADGIEYAPAEGSGPFAVSHAALADRCRDLKDRGGILLRGDPRALGEIDVDVVRLASPWTPPEGLVGIAARRLSAGDFDNPISLVPAYVVPPAISTPKDASILPVQL